jgi:hypothetical protein
MENASELPRRRPLGNLVNSGNPPLNPLFLSGDYRSKENSEAIIVPGGVALTQGP